MLMLMAQELKNPWEEAAVNPAPSVLALLEDNPFGSFDEMFLEQKLEWEPFDRRLLLDDLTNNPKSNFDVRGQKPYYIQGSIARHPLANTVTFRINPDYLSTPEGLDRALAYLGRWQHVLPRFTRGKATADERPSEYFFNLGLEPLPDPFGSFLGWHTLMSRRGYEAYFDLEDLLRTPAHRVEELADAAVAITAYPDPFNFESAESHRKILELTQYLNERRKDRT
jgi:hypothetical protein